MTTLPTRLRGLALLLIAAVLSMALVTVTPPTSEADAADLTGFDPGFIVTDDVFYNGSAMSAAEIQAFIVKKSPGCTDYTSAGTKYTCLATYKMATTDKAYDADNCSAYNGVSSESASAIIYKVARACGINPQVILVTLQKEQGFLTGGARSSAIYRKAMGMGCPDTSVCNSAYYGFFNQVYKAAWQLKQYGVSNNFRYKVGATLTIPYHPSATCGGKSVKLRNMATAALYNYTPYQPNPAALRAGYSTGDKCSSYGNRNFFNYFSDWFGAPANLLKSGGFENGSSKWTSGTNGAVSLAVRADSSASQGGSHYAAVNNRGAVGRWVRQSVSSKVRNGAIYTGAVWVKSGLVGTPFEGVLRVGAAGTSSTYVDVPFTAGDEWKRVEASVAVNSTSMKTLRLNVQLNTKDVNLRLDGAELYLANGQQVRSDVNLRNPSFEKSSAGWTHYGPSGIVSALKKSSAAKSGKYYWGAKANQDGQSIRQRVSIAAEQGKRYVLGGWFMSSKPGETYTGRLRIVTSDGVAEEAYTDFTVGYEWTYVTVGLDVKNVGHTALSANIRLDDKGKYLRMDGLSISPNLITGGSFENGATEVWEPTGASTISTTDGVAEATTPLDGYAMLRVAPANGAVSSVALHDRRILASNETFTLTAWVKSAIPGKPFTGRLALWGRGGDAANAYSEVPFTTTDAWQKITVTHKVPSDRTWLRAEFFLDDLTGSALLVDRVQVR